MSNSFPPSAFVRHRSSKVAQTPWFCSDFCGMTFDMKNTMSLSARLSVRSADGHIWPRSYPEPVKGLIGSPGTRKKFGGRFVSVKKSGERPTALLASSEVRSQLAQLG